MQYVIIKSGPRVFPYPQILSLFFFKDLFLLFFIGKADIQRGETERKIFHPMIHSPSEPQRVDTMPIRSQEPLPGLPRGCRVPKLWAVLDCFPRPLAGSWKGSEAAGAHMGSRACKARTFNHLRHRAGPLKLSFLKKFKDILFFYCRVRYTERRRDREEYLLFAGSLPK